MWSELNIGEYFTLLYDFTLLCENGKNSGVLQRGLW